MYFFTAKWCPNCRLMKPIILDLVTEGYNIEIIDVDEMPEMAEKYSIMSIPVLVKDTECLLGYKSKEDVLKFIS